MDLKKAFDTKDHTILIQRLENNDICVLLKTGYKVIYKINFNLSNLVIQSQNC